VKLEIKLSMVHHNPGEKPFITKFTNPETLAEYGFNGQVFKHINTVVTFDKLGHNLFPENSPERLWIEKFKKTLKSEIDEAKNAGLLACHHIDLFVLPKKLVEIYRDQICDVEGKISLDKEMTLYLHKVLLDEIFEIVPNLDALIIRVGETYLHDTPYHIGNGAVKYGDTEREKEQFVKLISFLREEVCVKRNKKIFFRTWDCFDNRFHTNLQYYLEITNRIEIHENLYFSIKYTSLDFWRRVKNNECLTRGIHNQIIEVQCQREYEGKGAYPSYVMNDVVNGDSSLRNPIGLKNIVNNPLIKGVYVWPRGGGWHGPYITDELWCDLNTYVISKYANDTSLTEEYLFDKFSKEHLNLSDKDVGLFRELCLMANEAILKTRYIEHYDATLKEKSYPCCNWMRDDCLGGLKQLMPAFDVLYKNGKLFEALSEKGEGYKLWQKVYNICKEIDWSNSSHKDFVISSCEYAMCLFSSVYCGWKVMTYGYLNDKGVLNTNSLKEAIKEFDASWKKYENLSKKKNMSTLYGTCFLDDDQGIGTTVEKYRKKLNMFEDK